MTQEEKAKAYDEALSRAIIAHKDEDRHLKATLERIFPELRESEDEKIRKELIEHCKNQAKPYIYTGNECPQIQSWIAWLEKQGKQILANSAQTCKDEQKLSNLERNGMDWSEEDEKKRKLLITILEVNHPKAYFKAGSNKIVHLKELVDWLKSLKERIKNVKNR